MENQPRRSLLTTADPIKSEKNHPLYNLLFFVFHQVDKKPDWYNSQKPTMTSTRLKSVQQNLGGPEK